MTDEQRSPELRAVPLPSGRREQIREGVAAAAHGQNWMAGYSVGLGLFGILVPILAPVGLVLGVLGIRAALCDRAGNLILSALGLVISLLAIVVWVSIVRTYGLPNFLAPPGAPFRH